MKIIVLGLVVILMSCQKDTPRISGRWTIEKYIYQNKEFAGGDIVTFYDDGTFQYGTETGLYQTISGKIYFTNQREYGFNYTVKGDVLIMHYRFDELAVYNPYFDEYTNVTTYFIR